jgi:DNA-binding transcriptional LysR family regulator
MNLAQLETLIWVARLKSFSMAATRMNTTQPAVSKRIQELERELGVSLFNRTQRHVQLTPKGRECLGYAEKAMAVVTQLKNRISVQHVTSGRASLGVSELIAQTWLPELLFQLKRDYPELIIDPTVDMTLSLLRGFETGDYDVILIGGHGITSAYPVLELGESPYAWMAKPGTEDPTKILTPRDLQKRQILIWTKQAALYQSIENWFIRHNAYPTDRILCNTTMAIVSLTIAGLGISLLPIELVKRQLADNLLCIIPTEPRFAPVRYQATYVPSIWPGFGRIIAEAAERISWFRSTRR